MSPTEPAVLRIELDGQTADVSAIASLGLYNYGHFTSMRVEDMRVRGLALHLDRLSRDCKVLFNADLDQDHVRQLLRRAAADVPSPVIIRVTVFDPDLDLSHPGNAAQPRVLVTARPAPTGVLPPLRLQTRRYARDLPAVKHAGLFGAIHHRREAQRQGYDDVLFTTDSSHLTEGATWNIGFLTSEQIIWPNGSCLPGVTMRLVQGALPALGMESATRPLHRDELGRMEAAFITNAGVGVRSVASIDSVAYAPDVQAIDRLQERYLAIPGDPL